MVERATLHQPELYKVNCIGCGEFLVYAQAGSRVSCWSCGTVNVVKNPNETKEE